MRIKSTLKRITVLVIICSMLSVFTGCRNDVNLTNEQSDLIAEYIAGTLLKYSYDNQWKYQKLNNSINQDASNNELPTSGEKESQSQTESSGTEQTPAISEESIKLSKVLPEALGMSGAVIRYSNAVVGSSYPTGEYVLSVPANHGKKIVALEFSVINNTGAPIVADTKEKGVLMKLAIGNTKTTSYGTLLINDLLHMNNVTIAAGETYNAVVLFQVNEDVADKVSGSVLTVLQNGTEIASLTIE